MSSLNNIGIVILAAGVSARLGKPKQLLKYNGSSLLQNAIDAAVTSVAASVIVVLGANADDILQETGKAKINIIVNSEWEQGMASSIGFGLNELLFHSSSTEAVILMVCDQPHISSTLINELIQTHIDTGKPIIACNYGESIGPPALFHKKFFPELMQLKGDAGARKIIQQHGDEVITILFTKGSIDIDTAEDYENLKGS